MIASISLSGISQPPVPSVPLSAIVHIPRNPVGLRDGGARTCRQMDSQRLREVQLGATHESSICRCGSAARGEGDCCRRPTLDGWKRIESFLR